MQRTDAVSKDALTAFQAEMADSLILLDIYPAREEPIEGVNSEMVFDMVDLNDKKLVDKVDLLDELKERELEVLCTIGAGDIDQLVAPISTQLTAERK